MTDALSYADLAYDISVMKTELQDIGDAFGRDKDNCTALLARDASVAVSALSSRLEFLHKRAAADECAAQAAVVACLRAGETVEGFTVAAVEAEVARRQRDKPGD